MDEDEGAWAHEMRDQPERDEPQWLHPLSGGWEPYDERPELVESRGRAGIGGRGGPGFPYGDSIPPAPRVQHWYDLDAATAASLMVLGALAVPVAGVALWVGRRFRVVRR